LERARASETVNAGKREWEVQRDISLETTRREAVPEEEEDEEEDEEEALEVNREDVKTAVRLRMVETVCECEEEDKEEEEEMER
jgi:hypothetical protein